MSSEVCLLKPIKISTFSKFRPFRLLLAKVHPLTLSLRRRFYPTETLRKLQQLHQASTEVQTSSSTAMPNLEMDASVILKLQQLKIYLFELEVLAVV